MNEKEDIILVKETLNGNLGSFGELVKKYQNQIFNLVYRLTANRAETEDISQDIFLHVYKNLNKLKGELRFKSGLYKIALNFTKNKLRQRKFAFFSLDKPIQTEEGEMVYETATNGQTPETILLEKEAERDLRLMLKNLPLKYRTIFVLRYLQGLSYEEISKITRTSLGTIKNRLFRTHKILSRFIRKNKIKKNETF